jgi:hypothetical protein
MGVYQKDLTAWFSDYFYFRGFFIRLKSSLYYLANFKRFFILTGPRRLFSYKNRIVSTSYYSPYEVLRHHKSNKDIETIAEKLKFVQEELGKRGKKFLCIEAVLPLELQAMINSKLSKDDKIAQYYMLFEDYYKSDADKVMNTYKDLFDKYGINYFDANAFLRKDFQSTGINPISFYDSHWNRYGAGLVVIETLKYLKSIYKTDWDLPQIKLVEFSSSEADYETLAIRGTFLFSSLIEAFMPNRARFPYIVYGVPKNTDNHRITVLGDSFAGTYATQLIASKFSDKNSAKRYLNNEREVRENVKKIINDADIIIIVYTGNPFFGSRLEVMTNIFYYYLKTDEKK